jgi:hypothetical protein
MGGRDSGRHGADPTGTRHHIRHCVRALPLLAALALGLALAGCDHCGDFYWQGQTDACHAHPDQN